MRQTMILFFAIVFCCSAMAQGNLQFNKVIRVKNTTVAAGVIGSITVPTGKVWKIESAADSLNYFNLFVDGQLAFYSIQESSGTTTSWPVPSSILLPIWLGPGTYNLTCTPATYTGNNTTVFSGIEFNVVP